MTLCQKFSLLRVHQSIRLITLRASPACSAAEVLLQTKQTLIYEPPPSRSLSVPDRISLANIET